METPVFPIIRQGLVACVDDSAIELHPLIDVVDDVIGTLTELEIDLYLWLRRLKIECQWIRLADSTSAGENLPGCQKRLSLSPNKTGDFEA